MLLWSLYQLDKVPQIFVRQVISVLTILHKLKPWLLLETNSILPWLSNSLSANKTMARNPPETNLSQTSFKAWIYLIHGHHSIIFICELFRWIMFQSTQLFILSSYPIVIIPNFLIWFFLLMFHHNLCPSTTSIQF